MGATQTTYSRRFDPAFAGQLGDSDLSRRIVGRLNVSGAAFNAGVFCKESTASERAADVLASTNDEVGGVVLNMFARNPGDQSAQLSASQAYLAGVEMPVLERGTVWVVKDVDHALAVGDDVYVRFANGANGTTIGAVRFDADTASARKLPGARVELAAATTDTLVLISFDIAADHAVRA